MNPKIEYRPSEKQEGLSQEQQKLPAMQGTFEQWEAATSQVSHPPDIIDETSFTPLTSKPALDGRPPVLMLGEEDIYWMTKVHLALLNCGFNSTDEEIESWFFGEGTREAVLAFQSSLSLPETGLVDRETWDSLLAGDPLVANEISEDLVAQKVPTSEVQGEEYHRLMEARFAKDEAIQKLLKLAEATPAPPTTSPNPPNPLNAKLPLPPPVRPIDVPLSPILSSLFDDAKSNAPSTIEPSSSTNASDEEESVMGGMFGIQSFSDEERAAIEKMFASASASASGSGQSQDLSGSSSSTFFPLSMKNISPPPPSLPSVTRIKWPVIQDGDGGAEVRAMQAALTNAGFYCGEEDMQWWQVGEPTRQALLTFQASVNLPQTGVCDQQTWLALLGPSSTPDDIKKVRLEGNEEEEEGYDDFETDMTDSSGRVWLLGEQRWSKPNK